MLKKEIMGTNINIGMAAIGAANSLLIGLRKNGKDAARLMMGATLLKYKEKRPMVLDLVAGYLEPALKCINIQDIIEEIVPCITNVAPGVRTGTVKFIATIAKVTFIDVLQNI
jgi:hypothetical protein